MIRHLRSLVFAVVLVAMFVIPASAQTQGATNLRVLVYHNIDTPTWFNYTVDECAANVNLRISFKPDAYPWTQYVYRDTPNVSGVQGFAAYTVCATPVASFTGPGTITIIDVDTGLQTTTHTGHYDDYGTLLIRLRVTATSGE